ncbi:MAG: GNAT family N-acetyltransferase [Bacteroidales bacterium]|nr:GNAT family N-acetyltransferase [Bacteroidales bacterium]
MKNQTKINLRALEPEDIDLLYKWENDKQVWLISDTITPFSRYILRKYLNNSHLDIYQAKQLRLMIDIFKDKKWRTVGSIDLFDFNPIHLRAGIGILIGSKSDRNKGIASLALKEIIAYAFSTLNLHQLYCNIQSENTASLNLFQKAGFRIIGTKKEWVKTTRNEYVDEVILQLINTDN